MATSNLADIRTRLLDLQIEGRRAKKELERVKLQAEQSIIDGLGGDVKKLGPNAEAQERKLALLLEDYDGYRVAATARDSIEETLLLVQLEFDLAMDERHDRDYMLRARLVTVLESAYGVQGQEQLGVTTDRAMDDLGIEVGLSEPVGELAEEVTERIDPEEPF